MEVARQKFLQMKELAKEQAKYWVNAGGEGGLSVFGPNNTTSVSLNQPSNTKSSTSLAGRSKWLHDNLVKSVCLWTSPDEVRLDSTPSLSQSVIQSVIQSVSR